jgi:translation initiation factor 2 alpha subunit (eIF-2alpha)
MDNYITLKTVRTKASENIQIRLLSYGINGNNDIKYALNFVEFPSFSEISKEFEIQINYISASTYLILINQKDYGDCNLENIKNILINDIKKRTDERKIMFDYKK